MIPEKLKVGDEVRIIAPARSMNILGEDTIEIATKRLNDLGLKVTYGKYVNESQEYFNSASIEHRVEDLHDAFADKNVKAILTVIGGFNSNQIIDYLDYDLIKNNPKILCGFSDITAVLDSIYARTGLVTYYGPHFSSFGMKKGFEYELEYFKKMFFEGNKIDIESSSKWSNDPWFIDQENRNFIDNKGMFIINEGEAEGKIVGGNLCTLNLLNGTKFMPDLNDTILFIEDDALAREIFMVEFDRNLEALTMQKGFENVKGIVIGRAEIDAKMTDDKWIRIIKGKEKLKNIPVIAGADFGHTTPIFTFPIGGKAKLVAKDDKIQLEIEG